MPLEFKTGKATNGHAAMEHNAQVMLYTLLMSERYKKNIDYGLLYYLHTDQTQGIDFIRICREEAVHEEICGHCINGVDVKSTKEIKVRLDEAKVVAVTCLGIASPLLCNKKFDVCIMDEAGQITLPLIFAISLK